jgi:hypothetical protein
MENRWHRLPISPRPQAVEVVDAADRAAPSWPDGGMGLLGLRCSRVVVTEISNAALF